MKTITTAMVTGILVLSGTSAFAGTTPEALPIKSNATNNLVIRQTHAVQAPTLIETGRTAAQAKKRRVTKVEIKPLDTLVAREALSSEHNHFLYRLGKHANTKTKTYRPSTPTAADMPNLFRK